MSEIIIYTARLCPYCTMAKRLFDKKGVSYSEINVDSKPELRAIMVQQTKRRTVPQIFIGESHIGGFDDLHELEMTNQLDPLIKSF